MQPEKLYRPREVATLWGVTVSLVYKRIASRDIAVIRPSVRTVRIPHSELVKIAREGFRPRRSTEISEESGQ